ncbi:MAG: cupin domain-containing protein [Bryobacterales bacterium]|nr:cupin domain-containing protein [Bryobacterales bacterium]
MPVQRWKDAEREQMNPQVVRQVLHGQNITIARLELKKGAVVPEHHHVNEQIANVMEGAIVFHVGGEEHVVNAGESFLVPPNVPHKVSVLEDAVVYDVFSPIREDWLRGDDAYLR